MCDVVLKKRNIVKTIHFVSNGIKGFCVVRLLVLWVF